MDNNNVTLTPPEVEVLEDLDSNLLFRYSPVLSLDIEKYIRSRVDRLKDPSVPSICHPDAWNYNVDQIWEYVRFHVQDLKELQEDSEFVSQLRHCVSAVEESLFNPASPDRSDRKKPPMTPNLIPPHNQDVYLTKVKDLLGVREILISDFYTALGWLVTVSEPMDWTTPLEDVHANGSDMAMTLSRWYGEMKHNYFLADLQRTSSAGPTTVHGMFSLGFFQASDRTMMENVIPLVSMSSSLADGRMNPRRKDKIRAQRAALLEQQVPPIVSLSRQISAYEAFLTDAATDGKKHWLDGSRFANCAETNNFTARLFASGEMVAGVCFNVEAVWKLKERPLVRTPNVYKDLVRPACAYCRCLYLVASEFYLDLGESWYIEAGGPTVRLVDNIVEFARMQYKRNKDRDFLIFTRIQALVAEQFRDERQWHSILDVIQADLEESEDSEPFVDPSTTNTPESGPA